MGEYREMQETIGNHWKVMEMIEGNDGLLEQMYGDLRSGMREESHCM